MHQKTEFSCQKYNFQTIEQPSQCWRENSNLTFFKYLNFLSEMVKWWFLARKFVKFINGNFSNLWIFALTILILHQLKKTTFETFEFSALKIQMYFSGQIMKFSNSVIYKSWPQSDGIFFTDGIRLERLFFTLVQK